MEVLRRPYFSAKLVSVVIPFTATISSSAKGRLSQRTNSNLPAAQRKANRKPHPQSGNPLPFHFCAALFMTALRIDGCHPIGLLPAASLLPPPLGPVPISQRSPAAFGIAPRSQPPLPGRDLSRYIATGTLRLCTSHRGHNTIIHAPSGAHDQSFKTYRHNSMLSIRLTIIQTSLIENQQPYNSLGHIKPTSSLPLLRSFAPGSWRCYASQNNRIMCSRRSRDIAGNALQRQGGEYRER